jgi:hypothetical protein
LRLLLATRTRVPLWKSTKHSRAKRLPPRELLKTVAPQSKNLTTDYSDSREVASLLNNRQLPPYLETKELLINSNLLSMRNNIPQSERSLHDTVKA